MLRCLVTRMAAAILMILFLSPNNLFADVRIDEHYLSRALHEKYHASIPDPLTAFAPELGASRLALRMPADGAVTSLFGWRRDPLNGRLGFHRGIDLANLRDSRIVAAESGRVERAGRMAGCGIGAVVDHGGGIKTRYCHLRSLAVRRGERVLSGGTIGRMGATGRATGSHLHFELLVAGRPVDPAPLLWLAFAPQSG